MDAVAYLWYSEPLEQTGRLYEQNCAACHGQSGQGDGFAASTTAAKPVAFTDLAYMFGRRSDVLYAKIRRILLRRQAWSNGKRKENSSSR